MRVRPARVKPESGPETSHLVTFMRSKREPNRHNTPRLGPGIRTLLRTTAPSRARTRLQFRPAQLYGCLPASLGAPFRATVTFITQAGALLRGQPRVSLLLPGSVLLGS